VCYPSQIEVREVGNQQIRKENNMDEDLTKPGKLDSMRDKRRSQCYCGGTMESTIGQIKVQILNREKTVNNVRHYCCVACQTRTYSTDDAEKLEEALKYAYRHNLKEIQLEEP
jgi:hypothetical protein